MMQSRGIEVTGRKKLVKNVVYYLNYGFYGYGGMPVKLVKQDTKQVTIVKDDSGQEYEMRAKDWCFNSDPKATQCTS
jgi:hypothetical protein